MNFLNKIPKPIIGLSPMDGITDMPMRETYCQIAKPDLVFTEFINVEAIVRGPVRVLEKFRFSPIQRPIIAQLSGKRSSDFYTASLIALSIGFDGIDLNLGCPSRAVIKNEGGASLIGKYRETKEVIKKIKQAIQDYQSEIALEKLLSAKKIGYIKMLSEFSGGRENKKITLSVKTRTGYNKHITEEWIDFLAEQGLDFISLHGRTAKMMYGGKADWAEIQKASKICKGKNVLLLGNGDIKNQNDMLERLKYSPDGILVGRGALGNPWIFSGLTELKMTKKVQEKNIDKRIRLETILLHTANHYKLYADSNFVTLRKHFAWYGKRFKGSKQLRLELMKASNFEEVKQATDKVI